MYVEGVVTKLDIRLYHSDGVALCSSFHASVDILSAAIFVVVVVVIPPQYLSQFAGLCALLCLKRLLRFYTSRIRLTFRLNGV